ncbi:MAG: hypothetical protein ABGW95_01605, partial [Candidatus Poseidoniia archaeon]
MAGIIGHGVNPSVRGRLFIYLCEHSEGFPPLLADCLFIYLRGSKTLDGNPSHATYLFIERRPCSRTQARGITYLFIYLLSGLLIRTRAMGNIYLFIHCTTGVDIRTMANIFFFLSHIFIFFYV